MSRNKGKIGEEIAVSYLRRKGYTILEQNYQTRVGEIDIIAKVAEGEKDKIERYIFFEVKARTGKTFGYPEESVTHSKIGRIAATAMAYLLEHNLDEAEWQIDVIAIELDSDTRARKITHLENITASIFPD